MFGVFKKKRNWNEISQCILSSSTVIRLLVKAVFVSFPFTNRSQSDGVVLCRLGGANEHHTTGTTNTAREGEKRDLFLFSLFLYLSLFLSLPFLNKPASLVNELSEGLKWMAGPVHLGRLVHFALASPLLRRPKRMRVEHLQRNLTPGNHSHCLWSRGGRGKIMTCFWLPSSNE